MNVKKMFASLTGVLMLAQAAAPMVTGAATYSDELQGAYDYAYSKGITTMTSIDNANMYGELTRGQLSKMISQWAEKEMGVKADETASCSFSDASTAEGDLATWVVKACQMGLMGQGINAFRPNDKVTRGEFGTVLSRAIWGDKYNQENPFYAKHLQALKDAGIMTKIEEPNSLEIRGWVMLMLQRAAETVSGDDECNDPAVLLACALGSTGCPAKCANKANEEDTAKGSVIDGLPIAGDLSIAVADYSSTVKSAPAIGTVVFNAVDFKASEKVTIESIKLERIGLSDKSAIKGVWFEKDGVAVSAKATLNSDGIATTRFYNNYSISSTDTLDLVAELSGAAGSEIAFKFVDVVSTAKNVSFNAETTTYRTTNYTVAQIGFAKKGSAASYKVGEKTSYEIGRFELTNNKNGAEDKAIVVKSLKLKNAGGLNLSETFKNVQVYRDSKVVSKNVTLDSKDMTIYFDEDILDSGKKAVYSIFAEVAQLNEVNETVTLQLKKSTELVANEKSTNFRVAYKDIANNTELETYTFKGGKVTFSNDSSMAKTVNGAQSATDIVLAKGTLTISEPVKLSNIILTGVVDGTSNNTTGVKNLKIEIGGTTYETVQNVAGNTITFKTTDDDIYVSKTSDVRVLADVASDAIDNATFTFQNLNSNSFAGTGTFDNSDEPLSLSEIAGTVQIAKLVVKPGKFNISNKNTTTQKVVKGESDEVTIFDGEITSKDGRVSVNDFYVTGDFQSGGTAVPTSSSDQITITLYVNGEAFSDATYKVADHFVKFSNLGDVDTNNSMKIKVTAQPNIANSTGYVDFKVYAEGSDENGNTTNASKVSAARLQITEAASITIANSNATSTVERAGNSAELVSFSTTVKDGSYSLEYIAFSFTGKDAADLDGKDVELLIDGKTITSEAATKGTFTGVVFNDINETLDAGKHTIALKASIDDSKKTEITVARVTTKNETLNATTGGSALNVKKLFVKAYPVLSLVKKDTDSNEVVIKVENPSDSTEDITINKIGFDGTAANISLNNQTVVKTTDTDFGDKKVTLAAGESTELRMEVASGSASSLQLNSINITADNSTYDITSDYTNVAKWADLKITYKS